MYTTFIVSFVGTATPTTIKKLASITHDNGGKWLLSKVNFIEHQVAAVIKIELPSENEDTVKDAFAQTPDLLVQFSNANDLSNEKDTIHQLRLDANDRAGIVNEISHVLDGQGVSILDMDCQRVFIAGGGGVSSSLFSSTIAVKIPKEANIKDIINELESLSEDTRVVLES
ncbi:glycine cleavage system regulatory protein [Vibrio nigripulchritudo ATCC 27043]|uniref:glycine cleavage system protein R n=1 Tax=Vibrio nigripulchritudo TaxID=28173 RepID=UPI00021C3115|nr:ACT domain-containing protein [Vibrio nigripulchritudo]EGU60240.1 glycine cleavage system regulatory protein [Vibrio nigripulchritudo ATCC 27043]